VQQAVDIILARCQRACVQVNLKDSQLTPVQVFDYVGMQFDLSSGSVSVPQSWVDKTSVVVDSVVHSPGITLREVYRVFGCLIWLCLVHNLPMCLLAPALGHWSHLSKSGFDLDATVSLPLPLRQWIGKQFAYLSAKVSDAACYDVQYDPETPWVVGSSDSSGFGAGFFIGQFVQSWYWKEPELSWPIHYKELSAALQTLGAALHFYPGTNVHLELDNTISLHALSSWYSKSEYWNGMLLEMWRKFRESRTRLTLEYVHTSVHRSDVLSRFPWYTPVPVHISAYQGPLYSRLGLS